MKTYVIELVGGPRDGEVLHHREIASTMYFEEKGADEALATSKNSKYFRRTLRTLKYRQRHKMNGRYCYEFVGYV